MTNNKQQLREADNFVNIVGELSEKNLEVKEFDDKRNIGEKYKAMTGELHIRTGEHEVHRVRFFSKEFTNAGAESRQFKALKTIQDEYISTADIAELAEKNKEEAEKLTPTKLSVRGRMGLNEFYGQDEQLRQYEQIDGQFANRLDADDKTPFGAEFKVEGIVKNVIEEFDREGEETDRAKIELVVPLYNGSVIPLNFVVDNEQGGKDYVMDKFEKGASAEVLGQLKNIRKVDKIVEEMGFGQDKVTEKVTYVNENLVQGGTVFEEGVHDNKIFDLTLLKDANVEREKYLEGLKTQAKERQAQGGAPRTGFGSGQPNQRPSGKSAAEKMGVDLEGLF